MVQGLFKGKLSSARRQAINPVKRGPTYFQILPQATSRWYSDHTHLSVPQTCHASVAFRIFAWPVIWAQDTFSPTLCAVNFLFLTQMMAAYVPLSLAASD